MEGFFVWFGFCWRAASEAAPPFIVSALNRLTGNDTIDPGPGDRLRPRAYPGDFAIGIA